MCTAVHLPNRLCERFLRLIFNQIMLFAKLTISRNLKYFPSKNYFSKGSLHSFWNRPIKSIDVLKKVHEYTYLWALCRVSYLKVKQWSRQQDVDQRTLNCFVRGNITVWISFSLTGLNSVAVLESTTGLFENEQV